MREPRSVAALEELGRVRLSRIFFMRDFLHSEIAVVHGLRSIPDEPDLAIAAGRRLCEELLEPLQETFGRLATRSSHRSSAVNAFGVGKGLKCARNEVNFAGHIWDRRDGNGFMGATACSMLQWFADRCEAGADWRALAWWIHDHIPYSALCFCPKRAAFNITWHERPERRIDSHVAPRGTRTKPGMDNHEGSHRDWYRGFPDLRTAASWDPSGMLCTADFRQNLEGTDEMTATLQWRGHTIKAGLLAGRAAAQVYLGARRVTEERFSGENVEAAIAAAKAWIDAKCAAAFGRRRAPNVATAAEYADYFTAHPPQDHARAILTAHAEAGVMTATELAAAAGWESFSAANLHYGKLGKEVADTVGLTVEARSDGSQIWTSLLAASAGDPDAPEFHWRIHPEVVDELRMVGLIR